MNTRCFYFGLLFVSFLGLSSLSNAQEGQDQAIAELKKLGGSIRPIAANVDEMEAAFHLSGTEISDEGVSHLPAISKLVWLNLRGTKITDAGLVHVGKCANLRKLHLEKTEITDEGLKNLAELKSLEYLNLYGTKVTDEGLKSLAGLPALKKVYVWQTAVTKEGADALKAALPTVEVILGTELAPPPMPAAPAAEEKK